MVRTLYASLRPGALIRIKKYRRPAAGELLMTDD
jgi:hypothetical protein